MEKPSGAVIMDSGGVLLRPTTGRWFPPPAFEQTLAERSVSWDAACLDHALTVGGRFLDQVHPVRLADEAAERLVWLRYHQLVLEALGIDGDVGVLAEAITARWEADCASSPMSGLCRYCASFMSSKYRSWSFPMLGHPCVAGTGSWDLTAMSRRW